MRWRRAVRTLMGSVLAFLATEAWAGTIGLAWNPSDGALGYRVHYGTAAGAYTTTVNVGNVVETELSGLPDCTTLHFAVTAYNRAGESGYSTEVATLPRPAVSSASPRTLLQGAVGTLQLSGANFESGASVTIDNPNVFLSGLAVTSCNGIEAVVTVEPTAAAVRPAQAGRFNVRVTNPSGLTGSATPLLEVLVNPTRFDVNRSEDVTRNRIDGADVVWLARYFGFREPDALYLPDFDFDGDGAVDGNDLALLVSDYGFCWSGKAWTIAACPADLQ